jgi:hypothetical protein
VAAAGIAGCTSEASSPSGNDAGIGISVDGDEAPVHVGDEVEITGSAYLNGGVLGLGPVEWHASTPEAVEFTADGNGATVRFLQAGPVSIWAVDTPHAFSERETLTSNVLEFDVLEAAAVEADPASDAASVEGWPVPSLDGTWRSIKTDEIDVELTLRFLEDSFVTEESARWRIADATHVDASISLSIPEEWRGDRVWAEDVQGQLDREGMFHMAGTIDSVNVTTLPNAEDVPARTHLFGMFKDGRLYVSILTEADTSIGDRPVPGWEGFLVFERVDAP